MQLRIQWIHSYCKISDNVYPWQTYPLPSNLPYIYAAPLHHINFTYNRMHIYPCQTNLPPPQIDHRSMQQHDTTSVSHIEECTYSHENDHRFMEDHYTEEGYTYTYGRCTPLKLTIDLWRPQQCISFTYRRMHIYPVQKKWGGPPLLIDPKCTETYYTKPV